MGRDLIFGRAPCWRVASQGAALTRTLPVVHRSLQQQPMRPAQVFGKAHSGQTTAYASGSLGLSSHIRNIRSWKSLALPGARPAGIHRQRHCSGFTAATGRQGCAAYGVNAEKARQGRAACWQNFNGGNVLQDAAISQKALVQKALKACVETMIQVPSSQRHRETRQSLRFLLLIAR